MERVPSSFTIPSRGGGGVGFGVRLVTQYPWDIQPPSDCLSLSPCSPRAGQVLGRESVRNEEGAALSLFYRLKRTPIRHDSVWGRDDK